METPMNLSVDSTLGATFIGYGLSCLAFGILTAQVYRYFRRFPSDRSGYKALVVVLWILELVDQIFIADAVYYYTITNYANPTTLNQPVQWALLLQIAAGALAGAVVKACFATRVWRFSSHNRPITLLIFLLVVAQLAFAVIYVAHGFTVSSLAVGTPSHTLKLWGTLSLAIGAATDIVTAIALCWFLRKLRTGYSKSDNIVRHLTVFAVNTGALTSTFSLATLVLYNTMPSNFIFMAVYFVLSKLYAISFLAVLNTRKIIRGRGTDEQNISANTSNTFHLITPTRPQHAHIDTNFLNTVVNVQVDKHQMSILSDLPDYKL